MSDAAFELAWDPIAVAADDDFKISSGQRVWSDGGDVDVERGVGVSDNRPDVVDGFQFNRREGGCVVVAAEGDGFAGVEGAPGGGFVAGEIEIERSARLGEAVEFGDMGRGG
ncbi:MAG TPA: hypothetical protein VFE58_07840 [Tepidisphaeraceae bacterium]|nr:hypothetical protein [Tepidisphaeraceae bacterium]